MLNIALSFGAGYLAGLVLSLITIALITVASFVCWTKNRGR